MENSQSVQHEPTQPTRTALELTDNKSGAVDSSQILMHLLVRNPWLLLVGLLTMFLGSAAFALYSLGSVGYAKQPQEPEQIPEAPTVFEEAANTPSEMSNPIPLWMVVAIALSCGSGCLVILRLINQPTERQKAQKPKRYQAPPGQGNQHRLKPQTLKTPPVFSPVSSLKPFVSMQPQTKPLMTVLPVEHRHRLDNTQESLADMLDIRKQSSLSTILRKY
ncbi:hypothetical protein [Calothrix sp. PCC 7507]|uniref:hypothetical protein n=1 Tax=Calothrix sp. PCC 7507 TaxID=99598 RepID=UPI00029F4CCB|nr:hypothetical protein [Calothrix sp. PCC 7507]AFY35838.1 hypothetical protein Cal7507_5508 [Calothrix sp. PCC 7507]